MPRLDAFEKRRKKVSSLIERRNKMVTRNTPVQTTLASKEEDTKPHNEDFVTNTPVHSTLSSTGEDTEPKNSFLPRNTPVHSTLPSIEEDTKPNNFILPRNSPIQSMIRSSCSIIEDSDKESEITPFTMRTRHAHQDNVIIHSSPSNCEEKLNTSTICLSRSHSFFTDSSLKSERDTSISNPDNAHNPKVIIISNLIIKEADQKVSSHDVINHNEASNGNLNDNTTGANPSTTIYTDTPNISTNSLNKQIVPCEFLIQDESADLSKDCNDQQNPEIPPKTPHPDTDTDACRFSIDSEVLYDCMETPLIPVDIDVPQVSKNTSSEITSLRTCSDKLESLSVEPIQEIGSISNVLDQTIVIGDDLIKNNVEQDQKPPKKRKRVALKNVHIDFISEEEKEDFSSGSSDYWTNNESESSNSENAQKPKKTKKRKENSKDKSELMKKKKRINKRQLIKEKKTRGEAYETLAGKQVEPKTMKENPCLPGKCQRGCNLISEERRTTLFNFFMALDPQRQRDWLAKCAQTVPIERKKTKLQLSRRQTTYKYYINDGDDRKQVCQNFLLHTLGITQKLLLYSLNKVTEGMVSKDDRRRNIPAKYTEEAKRNVKTFIESLPAVPSHYCRKRTNKTYLPQEFRNILNLYRIYQKHCLENALDRVSEAIFRGIFTKEYNISFHQPKKDKCALCVKFENNPNTETNDTGLNKYKAHLVEKTATYERFSSHQNMSTPPSTTITSSFDLQKVLNTPFGSSMLLYYSRKYAFYNFTVYKSGSRNAFCYLWGESDGKRGSNEIGTCLYKYLEEVDKRATIQNVLLYCDSCTGQNKNKNVLAVINNFIQNSVNIQVIQINYLLPGHTYMPLDSVHAVIERQTRKTTVWAPSQWPTLIETARKNPKPYTVEVLEYNDFINFDDLTARTFPPDVIKQMKMRDIRVATFRKKKINEMEIKYSMSGEAVGKQLKLFRAPKLTKVRGKGRSKEMGKEQVEKTSDVDLGFMRPKSLYTQRLPISEAKYKDLKKLCDQGTIPRRFHSEYLALPCLAKIRDTLPQTDDEDDYGDE